MTRIARALALTAGIGATAAVAATTPASAALRFSASLTGAQVKPAKGDPDGTASVVPRQAKAGKVSGCVRVTRT